MSETLTIFVGVEAELLGVVGLDERAEHLLRALGARGVGQVLGIEVLEELDPARRAAGELRQGDARVLLHQRLVEPEDELRAFLDDREVGGEVGVEHLVEAGAAQRRVHLEGDRRAGLEAEHLARSPTRGAGAVWITTCLSGSSMAAHTASVSSLAYRAPIGQRLMHWPQLMQTTRAERHVLEGRDGDLVAAADGLEHADLLHVDAGADAAAAADALVHVAHDASSSSRRPRTRGSSGWPKGKLVTPYSSASVCSSQLPLRDAAVALAVVLAEEQLEHVLAGHAHLAACAC